MKSKGYWVLGLLLSLVLIEIVILNKDSDATKPNLTAPSVTPIDSQAGHESAQSNSPRIPTSTDADSTLEKRFDKEVMAISHLDEHPAQTEARLRDLAKRMDLDELKSLQKKTLDQNATGDERMLSVYLLSLSEKAETSQLLEEVVLSPFPAQAMDRQRDFENVLRAQAIEGLQNRPDPSQAVQSLSRIVGRLDDRFLLDRTQRALAHHRNSYAPLQEQDQKALQKLIE